MAKTTIRHQSDSAEGNCIVFRKHEVKYVGKWRRKGFADGKGYGIGNIVRRKKRLFVSLVEGNHIDPLCANKDCRNVWQMITTLIHGDGKAQGL